MPFTTEAQIPVDVSLPIESYMGNAVRAVLPIMQKLGVSRNVSTLCPVPYSTGTVSTNNTKATNVRFRRSTRYAPNDRVRKEQFDSCYRGK